MNDRLDGLFPSRSAVDLESARAEQGVVKHIEAVCDGKYQPDLGFSGRPNRRFSDLRFTLPNPRNREVCKREMAPPKIDLDLEAAGAEKCFVEHIKPVGNSDDQPPLAPIRPVDCSGLCSGFKLREWL